MNPITQHPEPFKRVEIYFQQTQLGIPGHRDGIWDGEKWLFRRVYTKDEYILPPPYAKLKGWTEESDRGPYEVQK